MKIQLINGDQSSNNKWRGIALPLIEGSKYLFSKSLKFSFLLAIILCSFSVDESFAQEYTFEAEIGTLFNGASIQDCESCSNGQQVGNIGGESKGYFTQAFEVDAAGTYRMILSFSSGDPRSVFISVNEGTDIEIVANSGDWGTVGTTELEVTLVEGQNVIRFSNDGGWGPNIDKFVLQFLGEGSGTGYSYEAEDGKLFNAASIHDCGSCSGGQQVGDLGGESYFTQEVEVDVAGTYTMELSFSSGDPRTIFISANNEDAIEVLVDSGDWGTVGTTEIEIFLNEGPTTIKFSNEGDYAPNIDKFDLHLKEAASNGVYSFEAENGTLFNGATIHDCDSCSSGKQVGDLGGDSNAYFTQEVEVDAAGTYSMTLSFSSGDPRIIFISVNGGTALEIEADSGDWGAVGTTEFEVTLNAGANTLKFFNEGGYAPNIDKFDLKHIEASTLVYEAEDGILFNGASLQDCGSCSGGQQVGDLGGDGNAYFTQNVEAATAGIYNMTLSFSSGDPRSIFISINGGAAIEVVADSGDWGTVGTTELEVSLNEGMNSLKFSNEGGYGPNIDKFELDFLKGLPECESCETTFSFGANGEIIYNTQTGTTDIYVNGHEVVRNAYSEVATGGETFTSMDYTSRTITEEEISDDFGAGKKITVNMTADGLPNMQQIFYTYTSRDYLLTEVVLLGEEVSSNYMAPLISTGVQLTEQGDNRILFVPFDNDTFIRYNSKSLQSNVTNTSSEVTAFYEDNSRQGLVVGSVEHTDWKTGILTTGSGNVLSELKVWGGYTASNVTRDAIAHGSLSGPEVKSPKVFIGLYEDWRLGLEEYGEANAIAEPRYIFDWEEPTPFGWNSWGAIQTDLTLEKAKEVVDFFAEGIPAFRSGETAYIDLDSYWDNMVDGGLEGDFSQLTAFVEYCKEKGLKPGIYWAPFVDWGKFDRQVEGSTYNYSDVWTTVNGNYHDLDGARAMDPTHPGTKDRIDLAIGKFIESGFEMIKIDFIGHAAIEGDDFYDPEVTTGMQAFKKGMEYLTDKLNGEMLVYAAISPNLATGRYVHIRRIACDAYADINATEYTLNSNTYGWWQSEIYNYIDGDHLVFDNVSLGENRARLTSGIVNGSIITGDDFSVEGPWTESAKELLQNQDVLEVARRGEAFRPVEGDTEQGASELFVQDGGDNFYIAVINYGEEKIYDLDLERLGVSGQYFCSKELFSGARYSIEGSNLRIRVGTKDAAILELSGGENSCTFSLPNNYELETTDVSCNGKTNGKIRLKVFDPGYTYNVSVSGSEPFAMGGEAGVLEHVINDLAPGTYQVCFTIAENESYEQCFELSIGEPGKIDAVSEVNLKTGSLTLKLKGADQYYLSLNGQERTLGSGTHLIKLEKGMNEVSIKSDLDCQGSYFERIYVSEDLRVYPNPTTGPIQFFVPATKPVVVAIYNTLGIRVFDSVESASSNGTVEIDLTSLKPGLYMVKISNEELEETLKIVKQ